MINFPLPGKDWRIVQKFGERPEVYAQFGMKGHNGLDLAPPHPGQTGVWVYAPHEGYVTIPPFEPHGYGNHIIITSLPYTSDGLQRITTLGHLDSIMSMSGKFVSQGEPIGIMGKTGFADGIHTHWTYKRAHNGVADNKDNGFFGAVDVLSNCVYWDKQ